MSADSVRLVLLDVGGMGEQPVQATAAAAVPRLLIDPGPSREDGASLPGRAVQLHVPRATLSARFGPVERLSGLVVALDNGLGRLFADCLARYAASLPELSACHASIALDVVLDLMSGIVGPSLAAGDRDTASDLEAAQALVDRHIAGRLDDPSLDVRSIARALGLSRSSLYRLFAGRAGVATTIRDGRLALAWRRLADPGERHRTIAEIASDCGFRDYPNFARAFRGRFGVSPRGRRTLSAVA